jgi:rSAM/selenodomain-associated transferase 1
MFANSHLIIFTRYPDPGKTKTRLIPAIGSLKAAELQRKMTEKIAGEALKLLNKQGVDITVFHTGGTREEMAAWLGNPFNYLRQSRGDIGNRMGDAFTRVFNSTTGSIILVGSDIPELSSAILEQGFVSLEKHDLVIGPSKDGGYYLIGMKSKDAPQLIQVLFNEIPWSTADVLKVSIQRLADAGYSHSLLATLRDIDQPDDLHIAEKMKLL